MNATGTFLPPTREMRAVIEGLQSHNPALPGAVTSANGIFYGQYHAPILEYIFPENVPGAPIVENNFNTIPLPGRAGIARQDTRRNQHWRGPQSLAQQHSSEPGDCINLVIAPNNVVATAAPFGLLRSGPWLRSAPLPRDRSVDFRLDAGSQDVPRWSSPILIPPRRPSRRRSSQ